MTTKPHGAEVPETPATLRIGEVAHRAGMSVEAVRYYERLGLVAVAARTPSGYREFDGEAVRRLRFARRAQSLGFTLVEIRELLGLRLDARAPAAGVRARAETKLADIEGKLADLVRMRDALGELTRACCTAGTTADCPILDALEGESEAGGRHLVPTSLKRSDARARRAGRGRSGRRTP